MLFSTLDAIYKVQTKTWSGLTILWSSTFTISEECPSPYTWCGENNHPSLLCRIVIIIFWEKNGLLTILKHKCQVLASLGCLMLDFPLPAVHCQDLSSNIPEKDAPYLILRQLCPAHNCHRITFIAVVQVLIWLFLQGSVDRLRPLRVHFAFPQWW